MGLSAVDIEGCMGHESIDITLHYAHMFPSAQKDMADKCEYGKDMVINMYQRLRAASNPKKKEHKRKWDIIVNFRMSPEERQEPGQRV